jgi:hypothetical protein
VDISFKTFSYGSAKTTPIARHKRLQSSLVFELPLGR